MALPALVNPGSPLGSDSPAFGDDEFRALKQYLVDVYGAPNNTNVTAGALTVATSGQVTVRQSPLTVPTVLRGGASQILRIESQYSGIEYRVGGATPLLVGRMGLFGWEVATNMIVGGQIRAGAAPIVITTPTGMLDLTKLAAPSEAWGDVAIRGTSGWTRLAPGTSGFVLQTRGAGADPSWVSATGLVAGVSFDLANVAISNIEFSFDGNSAPLTAGLKGDLPLDFAGTIQKATLVAYPTGSLVVDVYKSSYANFPPGGGQSITASAKPTLSGEIKYQDATLTGWTTNITPGDILRINIDSVSTVILATLALKVVKS